MGYLPMLEVDGKKVCESMAIARYIAREHGNYTCYILVISLSNMNMQFSVLFQIFAFKLMLTREVFLWKEIG